MKDFIKEKIYTINEAHAELVEKLKKVSAVLYKKGKYEPNELPQYLLTTKYSTYRNCEVIEIIYGRMVGSDVYDQEICDVEIEELSIDEVVGIAEYLLENNLLE